MNLQYRRLMFSWKNLLPFSDVCFYVDLVTMESFCGSGDLEWMIRDKNRWEDLIYISRKSSNDWLKVFFVFSEEKYKAWITESSDWAVTVKLIRDETLKMWRTREIKKHLIWWIESSLTLWTMHMLRLMQLYSLLSSHLIKLVYKLLTGGDCSHQPSCLHLGPENLDCRDAAWAAERTIQVQHYAQLQV